MPCLGSVSDTVRLYALYESDVLVEGESGPAVRFSYEAHEQYDHTGHEPSAFSIERFHSFLRWESPWLNDAKDIGE